MKKTTKENVKVIQYINYVSLYFFFFLLFFLPHRKATNSKKNHSKLTTTCYFMPNKGGKIKKGKCKSKFYFGINESS
jgi:hypothetical protein